MDQHYKKFVTLLHNMLSDLNRYHKNPSIIKFLTLYDKLDMASVIFRLHSSLFKVKDQITRRDDIIFNKTFYVLPEIDMSVQWTHLSDAQKNKIWTYIQILGLEVEMLMDYDPNKEPEQKEQLVSNNNDVEDNNDKIVKEEKKPLEFNPYIGIGSNEQTQEYGVNELLSNVPTFDEDRPDAPGLTSMISTLGIDKMINMDELSKQLKDMKREDIDNATNSIKSLLGNGMDENTSNLISDMLGNITDNLKMTDISNGKPLENIVKIAETVASKMRPEMQARNVDMRDLLSSTQKIAQNCKDDAGNPLFKDGQNPFDMLNKMTDGMSSRLSGQTSQEEYMNNCNNMMKEMGINVDLNNMNLNNLNLNQMMGQMQKQMQQGNTKKYNKKR